MSINSYIVFLFGFLIACNNKPVTPVTQATESNAKTADSSTARFSRDTLFKLYAGQITLPKGWRLAKDDTLPKAADATARYRFQTSADKLIHLDYGLGTSGNPSEPNVQSARFRKGYVLNGADTAGIIFSDNPKLAKIRRESSYLYTSATVSGFKAVYFRPKVMGKGFTGYYIDSIGLIAGNLADLVMYGNGLDSTETAELEKVSRSLIIDQFH